MSFIKENPNLSPPTGASSEAIKVPVVIAGSSAQPQYRGHSNSLSLSSIGKTNRRKSMSSALNSGALAASLSISETGIPISTSRRPLQRSPFIESSYAASVPTTGAIFSDTLSEEMAKINSCAVADDPQLSTSLSTITNGGITKSRLRRASEGSRLIKGEGKRSKDIELRCEKCGKGYKHSSCLSKHLWEHTPEWALTSKLLISKHQQVQLLEAASVLVAMNQDMKTRKSGIKSESDNDTPSQTGSSPDRELNDTAVSSTNTSPPPTGGISGLRFQQQQQQQQLHLNRHQQHAISSDIQSPGSPTTDPDTTPDHKPHISESAPGGYQSYFSEYRRGVDRVVRPRDVTDESDLACAVGLLSCSYDTRNFQLPADAPPVPPLPERFLQRVPSKVVASVGTPPHSLSYSPSQPISFQRGEPAMPMRPPVSPIDDSRFHTSKRSSTSPIMEEDISMDDSGTELDYHPNKWRSEPLEDEGVFGQMED